MQKEIPREAPRCRPVRPAIPCEVEDIRQLLALSSDPHRPCADVDAVARKHLAEIESKIARLEGLRAEVRRMIEQCACGEIKDCRVVEVLADHGNCTHEHH